MAKILLSLAALSCILAGLTCVDAVTDAFNVLIAISDGTEVKDLPISDEDKEIVTFWLEAVDEPNQCSTDYLDELKKKIGVDDEVSDMKNITEFLKFAHYSIMNTCGEKVIELGQELEFMNDDDFYLLDYVGFKYNKWQHESNVDRANEAFKAMTEWMLQVIGADKRSVGLSEFSRAWLEGPCRTVLSELKEPKMKPFANFIEMLNESDFDPLDLETNPSKFYIPVIQSCQYLSNKEALEEVYRTLQTRDPSVESMVEEEAKRVGQFRSN